MNKIVERLKKEFSKYSFTKFADLLKEIEKDKYDFKFANKFLNKYVANFDGKCTNRIVDFIIKKINN